LEEYIASNVRVEEESNQETSVKEVPPKRRLTLNGLHGVISKKIPPL
jgi:hypothetical protein